jgi:TPR repeat protein
MAVELAYWESIKDSTSPAVFEAYKKHFPGGTFSELADYHIQALRLRQEQKRALDRIRSLPQTYAQIALKGLGYYRGSLHGKLDAASRRAIKEYQRANGFPATGNLTPEQTVALIREAAERGQTESQNMLGAMAAEGVGLPKDDAVAVRWFRAAADQQDGMGYYNLAHMYIEGRGAPKDTAQAKRLLTLARARGILKAEQELKKLEQ